jgi:hypothetical protein
MLFSAHSFKAFFIHLCISIAIALLCLLVVYGLWYPSPLDEAIGVGAIFLLVLTIDIILGPLMTLVVFKPNKPSLKFDLTVIACIQMAALAYGLHTVGSGRPAYLVFTTDRFDLVQAYEVPDIKGTPEKPELVMQNSWLQPLTGYALRSATIPDRDANANVLNLLLSSALSGGPDIPHVAAYHDGYAKALPKIKATATPLSALKAKDPLANARVAGLKAKYPANSIVMPLKIKFTIYTVVMNPVDASILGIEPFDVF